MKAEDKVEKPLKGFEPGSPVNLPGKTWEQLRYKEQELAAALGNPNATDERRKELLQVWWHTMSLLFQDKTLLCQGRPLGDLGMRLQRTFGEISSGQIPPYISDAAKEGRPNHWLEKQDRAIAAAYIIAARAGVIDDKTHTKTVVDSFGLASPRPAQIWANDDKLRVEFPLVFKWPPEKLTKQLRLAGERYKKAGPTQMGILNRDDRDSN